MNAEKPLLKVLAGEKAGHVPFWFMRQAGRYLPEYRAVRETAGGFLDLAFNPDLAAEVTLQPLRRYGMDAAILFSDILVVPLALGQSVSFQAGEGPVLDAVRSVEGLNQLSRDRFDEILAPVYETVKKIRERLRREGFDDAALIGFAGAPWTVACYMVEGGGSKDFHHVKKWAYGDPAGFAKLIDILCDATADYLVGQIKAGAEIIQIFDSWAGLLDETRFGRFVIEPAHRIVSRIRQEYPHIPIIGFPRGAGYLYRDYIELTGVNAVSVDQHVPPMRIRKELQARIPVQGNLDPSALLAGGDALEEGARRVLETLSHEPFIFNLGHGIHKDTPPENLEKLCHLIRAWQP